MSRRLAAILAAVLAVGCSKAGASSDEYGGPAPGSSTLTLRLRVRVENKTKVVMLARVFDGDSLLISDVRTFTNCSIFSSEAWSCRSDSSREQWTLDGASLELKGSDGKYTKFMRRFQGNPFRPGAKR